MWAEYGIFVLKIVTILVSLLLFIAVLAQIKGKSPSRDPIVLEKLNDSYRELKLAWLQTFAGEGKAYDKEQLKAEKKAMKTEKKSHKNMAKRKRKVFVLQFNGNIKADAVATMREEISAILQVASKEDEVVLNLESPGGVVAGYGLAAAQLSRIRDAGIKLTVCVDKVAASGGYLMAVVADKIIAAPFAVIGSIGVIAQIPNVHELLKKNHVEVIELTAGKHTRPLSVLGQSTQEGKQHVKEQLQLIHEQFKSLVLQYRPDLDIAQIATGDYWSAENALKYRLVDELQTSDAYIQQSLQIADVYAVKTEKKPKLKDKLAGTVLGLWEACLDHVHGMQFGG